jgi:hypothetical protein
MRQNQTAEVDDSMTLSYVSSAGLLLITSMRARSHLYRQIYIRGIRNFTIPPLDGDEQAVILSDSVIAIVRHSPYRVDFVDRTGKVRHGPIVREPIIKVTTADKLLVLERILGQRAKEISNPDEYSSWPETVPPFLDNSVFATPAGRILVCRVVTSKSKVSTCDEFDQIGRRIRVLEFSLNRRVVGFGMRSIYLAVVDTDGAESIEKYPWK